MKVLLTMFLLFSSLACDAQNKESTNRTLQDKESKKMASIGKTLLSYKGKQGNLEYEYTIKSLAANTKEGDIYVDVDSIIVLYKVTNSGKKNYLVFNRGHEAINAKVYIEPQKAGIIEITQKRFFEPKDKNCPERDIAIVPNASWLKAKQTIEESLVVSLPLKVLTPFDDCTPKSEMPNEIKGIKFCLGLAEANPKKVKVDDKGYVKGWEHTKPQLFLCSDLFQIK
jgi:hypothetical protein